ncbi:phage holin family protein [Calothrix sp. NIES-3974]|uniref:phage holin family protein n=1 Tax=Calothrix sp. NIES-3974 TaxID=2005462 RepID=UPI000B60DAD7|nr:phage holin family protein [Calothrix sp. NIES-3974]BAZ07876.1 hypothetical protein NIES3974_45410 [Calothrix sp. NIES-3974]
MLSYFFTVLATALSLLIVDLAVPGVNIATFASALIAGVVIGIINSTVRPVVSFFSLPLNILTLGLFSLVVNGVCLWLAAAFVPGFSINGLPAIIIAPVVLSLVNTFLSKYFVQRNPDLNIKSQA